MKPPLDEEQARFEAERCLECGTTEVPAPCSVACPAGIDVPGFIAAIREGRWEAAQDAIFAENPLGGTCARVCPTPVLCEGSCVLNHIGLRPVEVGRLQRIASDRPTGPILVAKTESIGAKPRVAVVGAGPSGLACARELSAEGFQVTVYEGEREPGGLVRTAIAAYRQPEGSLAAEIQSLIAAGVKFEFDQPLTTREDFRQLEVRYPAIFLGIGLGPDRPVEMPGHQLAGVWTALPFIERAKSGKWTPAARTLVVIGAGNTAIDVARLGIRLGIPEVAVLYRRTSEKMRAYPYEVREAIQEGEHFQFQVEVREIIGSWHVRGVRCHRTGTADDDMSLVVPADLVVSAIGQGRRSELDEAILGLTWQQDRLVVDPQTGQTENPQYFAAGDAIGGTTVVEAVQGAKVAARGISQFVRRNA
jgi:glutamate synthase (NADPH/NADH) small chain